MSVGMACREVVRMQLYRRANKVCGKKQVCFTQKKITFRNVDCFHAGAPIKDHAAYKFCNVTEKPLNERNCRRKVPCKLTPTPYLSKFALKILNLRFLFGEVS